MFAFQNHKYPSIAAPATANIFGTTPSYIETGDGDTYELGIKFQTTVAGSVTGLRFYKGTTAAQTRVLRLWRVSDQVQLASVSVSALVGDPVGWILGSITPVALTVGTEYIVSYGKASAQAYAADSGFFNTAHTGPGGTLTAPSGTNGVFSYGGAVGVFPVGSFNSTNYYADVRFQPS